MFVASCTNKIYESTCVIKFDSKKCYKIKNRLTGKCIYTKKETLFLTDDRFIARLNSPYDVIIPIPLPYQCKYFMINDDGYILGMVDNTIFTFGMLEFSDDESVKPLPR